MLNDLARFEDFVRRARSFTEESVESKEYQHPFDVRIHQDLSGEIRRLFDNGHYTQATLEAFKFIEEEVHRLSGLSEYGSPLMQKAFGGNPPTLRLNPGMTLAERSEQEGYRFLFAGSIQGIRNPRSHSTQIRDDPDESLDYLTLASLLLRRLEDSGLR